MTKVNNSLFNELLKKNGASITSQRGTIFETIYVNQPISAVDLVKLMQNEVDRVSVYRTINLFLKLGIVQRINNGTSYLLELTDMFSHHHHHLICSLCGSITNINETELEGFIKNLSYKKKFIPMAHQIEIQGYCFKCSKK